MPFPRRCCMICSHSVAAGPAPSAGMREAHRQHDDEGDDEETAPADVGALLQKSLQKLSADVAHAVSPPIRSLPRNSLPSPYSLCC